MPQHTLLLVRSAELGWTDLRMILRSMEDIHVVGETMSAGQAVELATVLRPDVVIAAATVEGTSALPLLSALRYAGCPTSKVIVFATRFDPAEAVALIDLGIVGYLLWSDLSRDVLRHCLAAALTGDIMLGSRAVATACIEALRGTSCPGAIPVRLTERERAVLQGLAEGRTREEIARAEGLNARTVKRIVADLEVKFDAPNPFVLGIKVARLGLVR